MLNISGGKNNIPNSRLISTAGSPGSHTILFKKIINKNFTLCLNYEVYIFVSFVRYGRKCLINQFEKKLRKRFVIT